MSKKKAKRKAKPAPLPAQVSIFEHKHGVSFGVVPAGVEPETYWLNDGFDPEDGDTVESYPLPEPYQSAEQMRAVLRWITRAGHAQVGPFRAYFISDAVMETARRLASKEE